MSNNNTLFKFSNPQEGKVTVTLDNPGLLKKSYFAVEEPFVLGDSLPRDLVSAKTKQSGLVSPVKTALNIFSTFEEASSYAQYLNKPLMIIEIKPCATVKPQIASVTKIG